MANEVLDIIKEKYPNCDTQELATELNISIHQLRRIVSKNKIEKSTSFNEQMFKKLQQHRSEFYERNIKSYELTHIQDNIIIGSLLGDGSLACHGRSKESHYREHGCRSQANYRAWKVEMLKSLDFKYFDHYKAPCIKSPSNSLYSDYHKLFYNDNRKQINQEILNRFNHPLGLLCLYLDDGTLVIDRYIRKNKIHLFPRITLYSQSFTKKENEVLLNHIQNVFKVRFILKQRKDGHGYVLQCNYRDEIIKFLSLIHHENPLLDCMRYKTDLEFALNEKKSHYQSRFPNHEIIIDRYN